MSSKVGITRPLYNSAMGKAVLAEFSEEQVQQYLDTQTLIPYTENTITNPLRLKKLKQVQQTGLLTMMKKLNKIFSVAEYL